MPTAGVTCSRCSHAACWAHDQRVNASWRLATRVTGSGTPVRQPRAGSRHASKPGGPVPRRTIRYRIDGGGACLRAGPAHDHTSDGGLARDKKVDLSTGRPTRGRLPPLVNIQSARVVKIRSARTRCREDGSRLEARARPARPIPAGSTIHEGSDSLRALFFVRFPGEARGCAAGSVRPDPSKSAGFRSHPLSVLCFASG